MNADEHDVHSGWRRIMTSFQRAGASSKVKRRSRRRERREGKIEIREEGSCSSTRAD